MRRYAIAKPADCPGFTSSFPAKCSNGRWRLSTKIWQYQTQDWDGFKSVDFNRPISFTLAVALPKYGGGLSVWDVWHEEMVGRSPEEIKALIKSRERKHHAYRVGHMVLHSGHMVHQIAPMVNAQPDDERITLQGHGLLCDGTWRVYW